MNTLESTLQNALKCKGLLLVAEDDDDHENEDDDIIVHGFLL